MRGTLTIFAQESLYIRIEVLLLAILFLALCYLMVFYPKRERGFYSWHPVKRALAVLFFPLVLLYCWLTSGATIELYAALMG